MFFRSVPQSFQSFLLQDYVTLAKPIPVREHVHESLLLEPRYQRILPFQMQSDFLPWFSSNVFLPISDDEISTHVT